MRNALVIISLMILAGCRTPEETAAPTQLDIAIENLSITTQQLESVRKEKDYFVRTLEDYERQKAEYGNYLNSDGFYNQMRYFTAWHEDILRRERNLEIQYAFDVFAAHNQVAKRKLADPNQISFVSIATPSTP